METTLICDADIVNGAFKQKLLYEFMTVFMCIQI